MNHEPLRMNHWLYSQKVVDGRLRFPNITLLEMLIKTKAKALNAYTCPNIADSEQPRVSEQWVCSIFTIHIYKFWRMQTIPISISNHPEHTVCWQTPASIHVALTTAHSMDHILDNLLLGAVWTNWKSLLGKHPAGQIGIERASLGHVVKQCSGARLSEMLSGILEYDCLIKGRIGHVAIIYRKRINVWCRLLTNKT